MIQWKLRLKILFLRKIWLNLELIYGLRFKDIEDFKEAMKNYVIKRRIPISIYKSYKIRCSVKCKTPECEWNVNTTFNKKIRKCKIRTMNS